MELRRFDIYSFSGEDFKELSDDGDYVEWNPKLQEAWDKQQEMEPVANCYCPKCGYTCFNDWVYDENYNYCPNCGQKIKW